jgi:TRAP-type C4-dicarboxylate transport system substrate-binding protein
MKRVALLWMGLWMLMAWPTPAQSEEVYVISLASVAPDGSLWMRDMRDLDKKIREATDGKVQLKFYPGGVAGDDKTMVQKIRGGQLVGAGLTGVGLGEIVPATRVLEIPFAFRDYGEVDYVMKKLSKWFSAEFEKQGFKLLGWADQGFVYMMSQRNIASVDDVKKAKVWVWDVDPVGQAAFRSFGISPIPLSLEAVSTSLDSGMIDTIYISPVAGLALGWYKRIKFLVDFPIADGAGAMVISKEFFDKMPKEYQVVVETYFRKYLRALSLKTRKENDEALKSMLSRGVTRVVPTQADIDSFAAVGVKAADSLVGRLYSQKILDKVRELLNEYRTKK